MQQGTAIEISHLTKRYGRGGTLANDDLSLSIERGEVFGLLGPNGAGKTTLVLQMLGLLAPTSGSVVVEGVDVVAYPERIKTFTGYMPPTTSSSNASIRWISSGPNARSASMNMRCVASGVRMKLETSVFLERVISESRPSSRSDSPS